ncbi:MAG: hypothetical protein RQ756_09335 [Flavobacteriaceae bacterium]|nr:hypothetical protein [Flavobacteriaceae bacterium]
MKAFYEKLIERLESPEVRQRFIDAGISPVRYIDLYAGQDLDEENFELFAQNTVLVDWEIDYEDPIKATINIYACFEQLRDTSNLSLNRSIALKFLDYVALVDSVVCSIESESTGKLEILSEGFNKMDSIVDIYLLTYECGFKPRAVDTGGLEGCVESLNTTGDLGYDF